LGNTNIKDVDRVALVYTVTELYIYIYTTEKSETPERGHNGPKPVTAKCYRALLFSDKVNVNYIATSTFFRIYHPHFKTGDDKSIFDSYIIVLRVARLGAFGNVNLKCELADELGHEFDLRPIRVPRINSERYRAKLFFKIRL